MEKIFPKKLKKGDQVRIIAPSLSLSIVTQKNQKIAKKRFAEMGLELTFGKNASEADEFKSSSIASRIEDINDAFKDEKVKAVLTAIGGYNVNQLFDYLDWDVIKNNPKIFCGYSDITAIGNAIYAKTGLINYSGPNYANFCEELYFDYTLDYFKKCLFSEGPVVIKPAEKWSDDVWHKNQKKRKLIKNKGPQVINTGVAEGTILGGNLCTFNLLQGTKYFPSLENTILFLEDDNLAKEATLREFDRNLQSLMHQPGFDKVKGIVFGRFQKASKVKDDLFAKMIKAKKELSGMPIIFNVDISHTCPQVTFPIGGTARIQAEKDNAKIEITKH